MPIELTQMTFTEGNKEMKRGLRNQLTPTLQSFNMTPEHCLC